MGLLTDDQDIRKAWLTTEAGGNGDYYINIYEEKDGFMNKNQVRISTSGGNTGRKGTDVVLAVAALHRAMESAGFNEHPNAHKF